MGSASMFPARVGDVLLVIGVALVVGGLSVVVGGLGIKGDSLKGTLAGGGKVAVATDGQNPEMPVATATVPAIVPTERSDAERGGPLRDHGRPGNTVPRDRPVRSVSPTVRAGGTQNANWRRPFEGEEDERGYLTRSAQARRAAHWRRTVIAWDDATGYGTLEQNRAAPGFEDGLSPSASESGAR